jgi:hypothetical protein
MNTTANAAPTTTEGTTGKPIELGRYWVEGTQRVLVGRRVDGEVRVFDAPLPGAPGRVYFVESGIESMRELAALVRDYKLQAEDYGVIPMSRAALREMTERAKGTV